MNIIRKGLKDVWWRAYMVSGAKFSANDIPFCPTTAAEMPALILTYKEALATGSVRSTVTLLSITSVGVLPKHTGTALTAYLKTVLSLSALLAEVPVSSKIVNALRRG